MSRLQHIDNLLRVSKRFPQEQSYPIQSHFIKCYKMNQTYHTWTPYPNITCVIGLEALTGLNLLGCIISCIFNAVIFFVLCCRINFTDRLILSLTIADLLTSFISQPMLIIVYLLGIFNYDRNSKVPFIFERLTFLLNCTTCCASVMSIGFVVIARYIQIRRPLRYDQFITKKRLIMACLYIWINSLAASFLPWITGFSLHMYFAVVLFGLGMEALVIVCINISIITITRRIVRSISQSAPSPNKAMKTIIIISVVFTLSALPFGVVGLIYFLKWPSKALEVNPDYYCDETQRNIFATIYLYSILLYHTTSMSNPIVYTLRDTRIKSALKKFLGEKFPAVASYVRKSRVSDAPQTCTTGTTISSMHRSSSILIAIGARKSIRNSLAR